MMPAGPTGRSISMRLPAAPRDEVEVRAVVEETEVTVKDVVEVSRDVVVETEEMAVICEVVMICEWQH